MLPLLPSGNELRLELVLDTADTTVDGAEFVAFMRTALTRVVATLHEQPQRGARARGVQDLIADVKSAAAAQQMET